MPVQFFIIHLHSSKNILHSYCKSLSFKDPEYKNKEGTEGQSSFKSFQFYMEKGEELRAVTEVYRGFVGAEEIPSSSSYLEPKRKCFKEEVVLSKVDKGKESLNISKHK